MSQNKEAENLDDIFLIKDKNEPRTNKERSSEEKARETKQIVDNLKKMQDPGKRWNPLLPTESTAEGIIQKILSDK